MVRTSGTAALAATVVVAAMFACIPALPQREQELDRQTGGGDHAPDSSFDLSGQKVRNLDSLGSGNLVRGVRDAHRMTDFVPFLSARRYDLGPFVRQLQQRATNFRDYADVPKRNFDEIDRTGFDNFFGKRSFNNLAKRNFDEIDRTSFDTFMKRALYEADIYDREH